MLQTVFLHIPTLCGMSYVHDPSAVNKKRPKKPSVYLQKSTDVHFSAPLPKI
jgi:hypothetical protein